MSDSPRPRPSFGQPAPEGWDWKPPSTAEEVSEPSPAVSPVSKKPDPAADSLPWNNSQRDPALTPTRGRFNDRPITIALLVLGAFSTFTTVPGLFNLSLAVQQFYTQENLGIYGLVEQANQFGQVAAFVHILAFVIAVVWSMRRMGEEKRTFWIPLVMAAIAGLAVFGAVFASLMADPNLMSIIEKLQ